jgi:hypothetical protein
LVPAHLVHQHLVLDLALLGVDLLRLRLCLNQRDLRLRLPDGLPLARTHRLRYERYD